VTQPTHSAFKQFLVLGIVMFERLFRGIGGQMLRSFLIVIIISIGVLSFIIQQISFNASMRLPR